MSTDISRTSKLEVELDELAHNSVQTAIGWSSPHEPTEAPEQFPPDISDSRFTTIETIRLETIRRDVEYQEASPRALEHRLDSARHLADRSIGSVTLWDRLLERFPRLSRTLSRAFRLCRLVVTFQLFQYLRTRREHIVRMRTVAASPLFDAKWYLQRYPDVAATGINPAMHYAMRGSSERRSPGPNFDVNWYLKTYPDVAESGANPLLHYLESGLAEGRERRPVAPPQESDLYAAWVRQYGTLDDDDRSAIRAHIDKLDRQPCISIVVPVYNTPEAYLREMLDSVLQQIYPRWELCVADDASTAPHVREVLECYRRKDPRIKVVYREQNEHISAASNAALGLASGEFVALLDHDDVLAPHALYMLVHAINEHHGADIFYSDEDKLDEAGRRCDPYFKSDWNAELFYAQNFVNHLGAYRTSLVRAVGGFRLGFEGSQDYDLTLRLTAATRGPIVHIPHVLYHWRLFPGAGTYSSTHLGNATLAARRAISEHWASKGERVKVTTAVAGYHRVVCEEPARWPRVSVIVPTRDHADVLAPCIEGLLDQTDYPDLEILIVDNESRDATTKAFLAYAAERGVRVLNSPGPFNFSGLNNLAARAATGDILVFLNNDVSIIERSWLKEMITYATRPDVGAVGARLLYPDGRLQHGGVVLGLGGVAGHIHAGAARDELGYFSRLKLTQEVACVTAACMATPKRVFEQVGGFDEKHVAVAFNDVDLCIRIREAGYRIIWTPYAELFHWESRSRGADLASPELERFRGEIRFMTRRWSKQLASDPFFSPNLSLHSLSPRPAFPPRCQVPWRSYKARY